ncbi:MAG: hypothetical protein J0H34_20730 [Rhizobiales bacterium]|nr:hypothetical protein [Hyphomicrobiales bacterium]
MTSALIDDGGPAFPLAYTETNAYGVEFPCTYPGMSMRDWFAGQALAGMLADPTAHSMIKDDASAATFCFRQADAMLAERNKIASPAGETIRSAQDGAMEASPVTAQPAVGEVSPFIDDEDRSGECAP